MAWTISEVPVAQLKRSAPLPTFGFIEEAIAGGTAYSIGSDGYFIVASEKSLVPKFVVELKLPDLPNKDAYKQLAIAMLQRSNGMMWYTSADDDAYSIAWQLQLPALPSSPLFMLPADASKSKGVSEAVRDATDADKAAATKLLTSLPEKYGGKTEAEVAAALKSGQLFMLMAGGKTIGTTMVVAQGDKYAWLELFVLEESQRHRGHGPKLFEQLALEVAKKNRALVFGMSHEGTNEFGGARALGTQIVVESYHCFLRAALPDFQYSPSYSK